MYKKSEYVYLISMIPYLNKLEILMIRFFVFPNCCFQMMLNVQVVLQLIVRLAVRVALVMIANGTVELVHVLC